MVSALLCPDEIINGAIEFCNKPEGDATEEEILAFWMSHIDDGEILEL